MFTAGFIGCGNMATAIINGMIKSGALAAKDIYVYDVDQSKARAVGDVTVCESIADLSKQASILFLCVKPNAISDVAKEITVEGKAVISIAAGVKTEALEKLLPKDTRIMRTMPNTPLLVGKGAIAVQTPNSLTEDEKCFVYEVFESMGMVQEVAGVLMDAVTGVSGSGPAYVYLFVDALAKAGQQNGLDEKTAFQLALQTFEGACEMLKQTDERPQELIEKVCSPGGTTIEAMNVFEQRDIRGIIMEAVDACVKRSQELSGQS